MDNPNTEGIIQARPVYLSSAFNMEDVPKLGRRPGDAISREEQEKNMEAAFGKILDNIGEDQTRQGLLKTPSRAAKAILYFTKGYEETISGEFYKSS